MSFGSWFGNWLLRQYSLRVTVTHADYVPAEPGHIPKPPRPKLEYRTHLIKTLHRERFVIHYIDRNEDETLRTIRALQLRKDDHGVLVLFAYCEMRGAPRYFKIDRIQAVADCDGVLQEPMAGFWHRLLELDIPTIAHGYNASLLRGGI